MEMENHHAADCGGDEKICRRHNGKYWRCKKPSGDNKLQYCEKHYKDFTDFYTENPSLLICSNKIRFLTKEKKEEIEFMMKNKLLPDEQFSCQRNESWRCKNLRMGHGAADDDPSVPKSKFCQEHYNYCAEKHLKKTTRDSNCSPDVTGIKPAIADIQGGGSANLGTKRKTLEGKELSGEVDFTNLLTENPSLVTSNETKKKREMEKKKLPPDEQRCSLTNGMGWRCKKFRMSYGAADEASVRKSKFCEKHYNYYSTYNKNYKKKKRIGDGEGAGCTTATSPVEETNCSKPGEKVTEEVDDAEIQKLGASGHNTSDRIGRKKENVERAEKSKEPESLAGIGETVVELESLEHYKSKCFQLSMELEKKKVECTTLQGELLGVVETRKTFEDAAEYWRKMYSDLESRVLRVEKENSTMRCFFTKLDGLLPRHGKESSLLRCKELHNSEETESEAWGLQNEVIQSGEKHNRCNHNAETSSGGRKGSHVFELKTKENVHAFGNNEHHESESEFHNYSAVNISSGSLHLSSGGEKVAEGKGWGCSEKRPSQQHGSSSRYHLEMSTEPFVNLVSDDDSVEFLGESEDSDHSTDTEGSLGTLMDMLAMKYRNRNKDKEIKWTSETDMLSSFEEDPELYLKAVSALYRQQICADEISDKGLFHNSDALRCNTLAKFLMGKDCKSDLTKSVKELEIFDSNAVEDCKRLAKRYSMQLFSIYKNGKDPFFLPATTASHGDETAK